MMRVGLSQASLRRYFLSRCSPGYNGHDSYHGDDGYDGYDGDGDSERVGSVPVV